MTPTATVCLMSLTAKRPRGGYLEKTSTTMGFWGISSIMAQSPDLILEGSSSITVPVLLSILFLILENLQAMWEVWQSRTGAYPFWISPGWLRTITWAANISVSLAGSSLELEATYPLLISLTDRFF